MFALIVPLNFPLAVMESVNQLLESRLRKFQILQTVPGPSSVLSERDKLIKLIEMFPSHSTEELQDALNIHVTVEMAALALSSKVTNDMSDFDTVLLQPTFLPKDHDVITLQKVIEEFQQ